MSVAVVKAADMSEDMQKYVTEFAK